MTAQWFQMMGSVLAFGGFTYYLGRLKGEDRARAQQQQTRNTPSSETIRQQQTGGG
jgi:hypothetical protein